jgi:hypothetical protein
LVFLFLTGGRSFPRVFREAAEACGRNERVYQAETPTPWVVLVGPGLAPEPYFIAEEEVPRAGGILTRTFQRTRWLDGRVVLWLGRWTETGRGEGAGGLEFDVIEGIPQR